MRKPNTVNTAAALTWLACAATIVSAQPDSTIVITAPTNQMAVSPGQDVSVSVVRTGTGITAVAVHGITWTAITSGPDPLLFTFTIPSDASPGTIPIVAIDASGPGIGIVSAPVFVQIESPITFTTLLPDSPLLRLRAVGDQTFISVSGSSGSTAPVYLSGSSRLSYSSGDPTTATVDTNGLVTALTAGNTTITISYTNPDSSVVSVIVPVSIPAAGSNSVAVPNVVGLTQTAATSAITGAGLVVGTVTTQSSSTVPSGSVISENPTAGTMVNSGSAVNLVVSSGPAQVAVPNVVGLTQTAATSAITGAGLVVGTVTTQSSSTVPSGSVISENPTAGTMVNSGSAVNLVVSSGPAQIAVPNVVGLTQTAATSAITGAGLVVGTVTMQSSSTVPSGSVIGESPTAGTMVNSGSAVNLVVSSGVAQVPAVLSFNVLFGAQSYNVTGSTRNRLPWQITGIRVVFSEAITTGTISSLSGVSTTALTGLGTNTLTWTIAPVAQGSLNLMLLGSGPNALTDASGNGLYAGAGYSQALKVLFGDFNDDGLVNAADLVGVNNATVAPYNIFADINGDGVVNVADVQAIRIAVGTSLP